MRKQHNNTKRQRQLRFEEACYQQAERHHGIGLRKRMIRRMAKMNPKVKTEETTGAAIA